MSVTAPQVATRGHVGVPRQNLGGSGRRAGSLPPPEAHATGSAVLLQACGVDGGALLADQTLETARSGGRSGSSPGGPLLCEGRESRQSDLRLRGRWQGVLPAASKVCAPVAGALWPVRPRAPRLLHPPWADAPHVQGLGTAVPPPRPLRTPGFFPDAFGDDPCRPVTELRRPRCACDGCACQLAAAGDLGARTGCNLHPPAFKGLEGGSGACRVPLSLPGRGQQG